MHLQFPQCQEKERPWKCQECLFLVCFVYPTGNHVEPVLYVKNTESQPTTCFLFSTFADVASKQEGAAIRKNLLNNPLNNPLKNLLKNPLKSFERILKSA